MRLHVSLVMIYHTDSYGKNATLKTGHTIYMNERSNTQCLLPAWRLRRPRLTATVSHWRGPL